jgi:hypothetical protein
MVDCSVGTFENPMFFSSWGGVQASRDVTYRVLPVADRPELRVSRFQQITYDLHPHEPALDSLLLTALEGSRMEIHPEFSHHF